MTERRIEPGDEVIVRATVGRTWQDADARQRNVALARWAQLRLPSGGHVIVPVCDLEAVGAEAAVDVHEGQATELVTRVSP